MVMRIPWGDLLAGTPLSHLRWNSNDLSAPRFAHGAADTMWFGTLGTAGHVEVFSWPDASTTASNWTVAVSPWSNTNYSAKISSAHIRLLSLYRSRDLRICVAAPTGFEPVPPP